MVTLRLESSGTGVALSGYGGLMNVSSTTQSTSNPNPQKKFPHLGGDEAILEPTKSATQEAIERMEYQTEGSPLQVTSDGVDTNERGESINEADHLFRSEVEFSGYTDIDEYDNNAYSSNVDGKIEKPIELNFSDRPEISSGEEDLIDPQENKQNQKN